MKFLLLSIALAFAAPALSSEAPRPNIIFILTDDLGPGDLGVLWQNARTGTQKYNTPHLDQFAAEGLILNRHYSPISVCAPSRASFLLGVHQGHAEIRDNQFDKGLEDNHTVATVLGQAGYATANIGKWGLAGDNTTHPSHPLNRGFDYFFGYINHGDAHYHYPKETSARFYDGFTNVTAQLDKAYSTDLITARSKKWIADHKTANPSQPFFLYLAYTAPHARLDVPTQAYPPGGGLTGGIQWTGTPGAIINTASGTINSWIHPDYASTSWPDHAKRHATMVRRLDDGVHDLIQTLKDLEIDDNTLIVFTSDNGTHNEAGSGGSYTYNPTFFQTYGPYDGIKRDLWEGGIRVPAIVRWPAGIPANTSSAAPSQFHDWLPTFAELAGLPGPERSDGVSIVPTLTGQGTQKKGTVYSEYYFSGSTPNYADFEPAHRGVTRNHQQTVQIGDFKGIRTNISSHEGTDFLIYNVATDVKETTNLSGQPGVPTQRDFKDLVLRIRRASSGASRPYDNAPVPGISLPGFAPGLGWQSYEKESPWVSEPGGEPVATGSTATLDLSVRSRDEHIAILYSGYLRIPADGTYQFHLATDTGAFVRIHDAQLLDADFNYTAGTEKSSGPIPLKAGFHPIRIHYRHAAGAEGHTLSLQWSGPGISKQEIPSTAFFVEGEPVPTAPVAGDDNSETTGHPSSPGASVTIPVLDNDFDLDGLPSPLSIVSHTTPSHGEAVISGTNIIYTPKSEFFGPDQFDYTITDGESQSTATVRTDVHAANQELWFPLDETDGFTAREAGGRPLGTLAGFATPGWTTGKLSGGLRFFGDGNSDIVTLHGQKGVTGASARTVSFWVNANADQGGTRSTLISWGGNNGSGAAANGRRFDINLNHTNSYRFRVEFNGGGVNFHTPAVVDPRGAGWIHVAIVIPQNATIGSAIGYINGELATGVYEGGAASTTPVDTTAANDITFGNWATDSSRPFRGILDEIRIHPRVLAVSEISALANQTPETAASSAWHFRNTGNPSPSPEDWAADADGDGLPAWLEYALGGNPNISSQSIVPELDPSTETFTFNRLRSGIPAAGYLPEWSTDLSPDSWIPLPDPVAVDHPGDPSLERISVPLPTPAPPNAFVRLRVLLSGEESHATQPLGYISLGDTTPGQPAVKANTDSILSIPLVRKTLFSGKVGTVDGSSVTAAGADWTENEWADPASPTHAAISNGDQAGLLALVSSNDRHTLHLTPVTGGSIANLSPGDGIVLFKAWTLGTFFPADLPIGTKLLAFSGNLPGENIAPDLQYAYNGASWIRTTGTIEIAGHTLLHPGESFILRSSAAIPSLRTHGEVARFRHRTDIVKLGPPNQDNRIGYLSAAARPIGSTGLGFTPGDRLLGFNNALPGFNKSPSEILVWNGTEWIGTTGVSGIQSGTYLLKPGQGYIYKRPAAAAVGVIDWSDAPSYLEE